MFRNSRPRPFRSAEHLSLLLMVVAAAGCLHVPPLKPEDSIPHLARMKAGAEGLRRRTVLVPTRDVAGNVVQVAVHEWGTGTRERVLVLVHGVLSNHQVWRFLAADLSRHHDIMLVDLPGCGVSDRPDPGTLGAAGYSPTALADRVLQALRARLSAQEPPPRVALFGHSLGGAIVLRMTGDPALRNEFSDVLGQVDRAVLFAPFDVALTKPDPAFAEVLKLSPMLVTVASVIGLLEARVADFTRRGMADSRSAPREEAERMLSVLEDSGSLRAAQAMIRQAVPWTAELRPDWPVIEALVSHYENVDVPCLILWGARDETLPLSMGYKLQAEIPSAWLRILPRSMHSLPVERPNECLRVIRAFMDKDWTSAPSIARASLPLARPSHQPPAATTYVGR